MSLNRNSNHTALIIQTKQVHDFMQASTVHGETLFNTIVATVTTGLSQPSPLIEISSRDFEGVVALQEQRTIAHFLTMSKQNLDCENKESPCFLGCFFVSVVALLYLEEFDCFTPRDMILLIQDLHGALEVRQVSLERCHFSQHDVHRCLQTFF
jgi:hypothetical protein